MDHSHFHGSQHITTSNGSAVGDMSITNSNSGHGGHADVNGAAAAATVQQGNGGQDLNDGAMSSLDHALLESLFYNEMMLLDGSVDDTASLISNSLLSTLSADGSVRGPLMMQQQQNEASIPAAVLLDQKPQAAPTRSGSMGHATTISSNNFQQKQEQYHPDQASNVAAAQAPTTHMVASSSGTNGYHPASTNGYHPASAAVSSSFPSNPPHHVVPSSQATAPHHNQQQQQQLPIAPQSGTLNDRSTLNTQGYYIPTPSAQAPSTVAAHHTRETNGHASDGYFFTSLSNPALAESTTEKTANAPSGYAYAMGSARSTDGELDGEKRENLVSQFASLASRLGIALPKPVVDSLSKGAGNQNGQLTPPSSNIIQQQHRGEHHTMAQNNRNNSSSSRSPQIFGNAVSFAKAPPPSVATTSTTPVPSGNNARARGGLVHSYSAPSIEVVPTPEVQQLAQAAEAAVSSVVAKKRVASESDLEQYGYASNRRLSTSSSMPLLSDMTSGSASHAAAIDTNSSATSKQAPYSRRRKKPRLQDCESKLAELQAENAMLKRHLANLSSQSHALDQDRQMQEQKMRMMLEQSVSEAELDNAVKHFTEMYSDYGRRRNQELSFHLEQLQRLANPTNFTKLGLWTMGQQYKNSRNSIAGILQKELGISTQQGKKILEQRKRIQDVCNNLKECLEMLGNLKRLCEQKTKIFHDRMNKCREILTPKQVVKLILWINENTETLESVCPGWGSEHIHSKPSTKR